MRSSSGLGQLGHRGRLPHFTQFLKKFIGQSLQTFNMELPTFSRTSWFAWAAWEEVCPDKRKLNPHQGSRVQRSQRLFFVSDVFPELPMFPPKMQVGR